MLKKMNSYIRYLLRKISNGVFAPAADKSTNEAMLAQSYIANQEAAYSSSEDPWCNFSGPRFRILNLHYQAALGCLEPDDHVVADIGCGLGRFSEILHDSGRVVYAVDTSETAIFKAKIKYPKLSFEVGDVRFWEPSDGVLLDAAFLMDCYHRMGQIDKLLALENISKILKPNGKIIIAYGLDEYISGNNTNVYPDLSQEIFKKFVPLQVIRRQAIDCQNNSENANRLYVGLNNK